METSSLQNNATKQITEKDFINFIINNPPKYLKQFKKFNIDGVDTFKITWNWAAFLFGFWWFLYRKLYYWAFIAIISGIAFFYIGSRMFFLILFPLINDRIVSSEWGVYCALITIKMVWGITGNYIYYKHSKKKIVDAKNKKSSLNDSTTSGSLGNIGGINKWVKGSVFTLFIIGFIAAIFLPTFSGYHVRENNSIARACLKDATTAQEVYYVDNSTYTDLLENLVGELYDLSISEDVTLQIISASENHFSMISFHEKGDRKYQITGPGGVISEEMK